MALSNSFGGSKKMLDEGLGVAADPLALLSEELDKMWGVSAPPKADLESDPVRDLSESYRSESLRKMSDEELMARIQKREALKAAEQERQTALRSMSNEDLMARIEARKKSPMGALEYLRKSAEAKGVVWDGDTPDLKKSFDATLMALTPFFDKAMRYTRSNEIGGYVDIAKGNFNLGDPSIRERYRDSFIPYYNGAATLDDVKKDIQETALRQAIDRSEQLQRAQQEIENRGTTTMGTVFGKGAEIVGQASEMAVPGGLVGKFLVGAGTEAAARYAEHANGKIGYDENGNPVILDGDSAGKAAGEALLGGMAQSGIELLGGKVLGKVWGATGGKLIGKAAGTAAGQKVAENSIVKGVGKITNLLKTPLEVTGWSGMPGEIGEEFMQGATDAYFGLDTTDAEERGTTAGGRFKEFAGNFFKGENLADLAESMLLMQAIGGGSAYLQKRHSNQQLNKIITEKIGGVSENVLNKLSPEEKARIVEAHYQGLSAEEAADIINKGAGALDKFIIEKQTEATQNANGRAMLAEINPEAADAIRAARREGKDISRKMIRDLGLSEKILGDVESRNKFGDALLEDGRRETAKNAAKMDGQQEMALRQEIAGFVGDGPEAQRVYDRVTMKLKDASVLDDPYQREKLVMQAAEAVWNEDQAQRVGGARQKSRMAEKADHEARVAEAEAQAAEQENDLDTNLKVDRGRNAKGGQNETRANETQPQPEQTQSVVPPAGETARSVEAGEASSEVGREVEASKTAAKAPTSASTETKVNTPLTTAESAEGGSQAADAVSTPTKPKTVREGKAFVNSNIGKRYTDGKKTYEITGLTKDGEVSVKVTDKIGKSSDATLKLSGALTRIYGTKNTNAVWSEVKTPETEKNSQSSKKTTAETTKAEQTVPKTEIADKKPARVETKAIVPVVENSGDEATISAPQSIEDKIAAMPRGSKEQLKAQRDYLAQEIAKAKEAIKGKFVPRSGKLSPQDQKINAYERVKDSGEIPETINIKVPGDGEISVKNNPHGMEYLDKFAAKFKMQPNGLAAKMAVPEPPSVKITKNPKADPIEKETKDFVSKNKKATEYQKPYSGDDGYVYATNGRIMVRRKLRKGEKPPSKGSGNLSSTSRTFFDGKVANDYSLDTAETYPKIVQALTVAYKGRASKNVPVVDIYRSPDGKIHIRARDGQGNNYATDAWAKDSAYVTTWNGEQLRDILKLAAKSGAKKIGIGVDEKAGMNYLKFGDWEAVFLSVRVNPDVRNEWDAEDVANAESAPKSEINTEPKTEAKVEPKSETAPSITPAEAMKKLGTLGAADVDTLSKALAREERAGHTERANMIRVLRDYKRGVGTNTNPESDESSGGKYRASVEAAKPLDDPAFIAWAKKRGVAPTTQKRNEYDKAMADMLKNRLSRWIKGVSVKTVNFIAPEEGGDIKPIHDGERIVGSYNRATGEVKLAKGASVETVLHELGWHAARHWAEINADSDTKAANLLTQMKVYAESAPKEIKDAVRDVYGDLDADTLLDEIGAARFTKEQSGKIAKAVATKEGTAWYQKVWSKVVDFYKNFLTKAGYNRVDLDGVENMSPEVFGDFLADVMMSGKQLGERTAFSMEAPKGFAAKWTKSLSDYKAPIAELEKRVIGSSNNIYYLARTLEGQAQRGKNRAERAIRRVEKVLGDDVSPELLAQYMQLKAYEERNAKIERRNGKADASGMTPEDAKAIEKTIKDSGVDEAVFEEAAQILWDLQREGLQARVDAGLLDQETANKWMTDEPHHIPWKDAIDPDSGEYVGRRMGASEFDTAEGRKTAASGDPITWMLQEYQDAMTRAAQNRLRSAIANLTRLNGDVGTIYDGIQTDTKGKRSFIKYPIDGGKAKVLSIPEGVKVESTVKNDGGMQNVLTFKEGGETKYLVLNGTLGEAVAGAVTGRTLSRPPAWISWVMRGYAATATSLSPAFAARNITADNFDIHNNLIAKYGWVKGEKMFAKIVKEQFLMTKQLGSYIKNGDFKLDKDGKVTDFQKLVEAYEDAGGLIGGMATEGYEATVKKIQADFRAGRNKVRSIGKSVAGYWMMMQKISELAPRLSVFKTAMKSGMSAKEAAMLSRDLTVDFNKKGEKTPWFNTLWMFSNSALGANLTQMKGLVGKTGAKLAGGLVMYGFAEGMLEALMNGDDDEREKEGLASGKDINEYTRQNSLYIRRGDKVFRVNIHMGPFAYAKYFGNVMARTFSGMIPPEKAAKELGLTAAEVAASFTGLGNVSGDALVQTAVPTVIQPFAQMATNKDYAGRAVYRTKFTESKPDSAHGRKSTAAGYHWVASLLNSLTGGNEARKGAIDIAPETVKMLTETVGKNFARDIMEIAETGYKLLSDNTKDLDVRNVPFAGDFARTHEGNDNRFYENYNRYRDDKYELKKNSKLKGDDRRAYLKEHPWLYSAGKPGVTRIDNIVKRIEKLRDVEESDRATEERKAEAKAMRRKLQARVIEIMKGK